MPDKYLHQNVGRVSYVKIAKWTVEKTIICLSKTKTILPYSQNEVHIIKTDKQTSLRECQEFAFQVIPTILVPGDIILQTRPQCCEYLHKTN
jgi:hypothetical protein